MIAGSKKIQKFISPLLIILIIAPTILFFKPKKTEAFWFATWLTDVATSATAVTTGVSAGAEVTNTAISIKNVAKEVLKQVAMAIARKSLQEMTKSTVNWINSGFHGSPLFVENPESFFQDIAKYEVKNMVDTFGYDSFKYPFGRDFALNTINAYKSQLSINAQSSYSAAMVDPVQQRNYLNNFNAGGWNAFLINTQYPENNYLGFQMVANEELARRVQGTTQTAVGKVQTALVQGQGFLSPQTCPEDVNPEYNNGRNEWKQPSFNNAEWEKSNPYNPPTESGACADDPLGETCQQQLLAYDTIYEGKRSGAKTVWSFENTCVKSDGTSGLVTTTPGAVVSNQIMTALNIPMNSTLQAMGLGNSLSTIFDALLNKFIGDGLNSLASKASPPPDNIDNWSYDGQTLGSPTEEGTGSIWGGPDQEIILSDFKNAVDDGINSTNTELQLMSEITQLLGKIWPQSRLLDICLPGPDVGWKDRLNTEMARNSKKLQEKANEDNGDRAAEADLVLKELKFAVNFFKDWIDNKMMTELPNSIIYMDMVDEIHTLSQQSNELTDARRLKTQALARLQAIKNGLIAITTQPEPGSNQEKILISLKKQYDAARLAVSNATTVDDRQNELNIANEKLATLEKLTAQCEAEREAAGWGLPGGWSSSFSGATRTQLPTIDGLETNSEQAIFCSLPIVGGYTHETFINSSGVTYPETPLVNGKNVFTYKESAGLFGLGSRTRRVNIQISCSIVYKANILDYKGNLPGLTSVVESYVQQPEDTGSDKLGTCTYINPDKTTDSDTFITREDCALDGGTWTQDNP